MTRRRSERSERSAEPAPAAAREPARPRSRSLGLSLDPEDPRSLYQQLFDEIVARIGKGAFPPGFRLPPTRQLSDELDVHRNTVVRAYRDLEEAGFVESTVGRGTFVKQLPRASATAPPPIDTRAVEPAPHTIAPAPSLPWASLLAERATSEPIRRVAKRTRRPLFGPAIDLSRLQPGPDLLPTKLLTRCLEHVLDRSGGRALGYAPLEGAASLREQIALDLARQGVPASADDVIVTSGSQQALDVIVRSLVDPGDTVLVQAPTYGGALQIFAAAGARVEGLSNDAEGPLVPTAARGRPKLLYLMPNHANPTGGCISERRRRELVTWARGRGVPIVEDDYAEDLELDTLPTPPAMRALDGEVLYTSSYSKRLVPALRIGFVLAPEPLRPTLCALQHTASLGSSLLLQLTLAELLERGYGRAHAARMREVYRSRRDALVDALEKHLEGRIAVPRPARGVTAWLPLPSSIDLESLGETARREGVLVATGDLFSGARTDPEADAHGVRLAYCFEPEERLAEGARRFAKALEAHWPQGNASKRSKGPRAEGDAALV
ncbi:MAG: PLP-dependent aminotransferase family protein [Sandaracinaceae bacterium]|nr:PLP-dependent aminotransferase family protein [Sandaracinaceae bacterium]